MEKRSIQQIKEEIDLAEEVRKHGVLLKPQGNDLVGLCPFHEEQTPSFHVTPEKRVWHCFGCGKGGSVIDFVMETKGWDIQTTLESLEEGTKTQQSQTITEKEATMTDTQETSGKPCESESLTEEIAARQALWSVIQHYHQTLLNTPSALAYLQSRGLNHPEMLETFPIS